MRDELEDSTSGNRPARRRNVTLVVSPRCVGASSLEVRGPRRVRDPKGKAKTRGGREDGGCVRERVCVYACGVVVK